MLTGGEAACGHSNSRRSSPALGRGLGGGHGLTHAQAGETQGFRPCESPDRLAYILRSFLIKNLSAVNPLNYGHILL